MPRKSSGYERPRVTEYGGVEDITQNHNKSELGDDLDHEVINLAGSTHL